MLERLPAVRTARGKEMVMPIFCDDAELDDVVEIEPLGPEEALEVRRDHEQFRSDALYFDAHREELLARYPEQWVAIYCTKVVGVAAEHQDLLSQLASSGVPRGRAYIQYAADDDDVDLILACA
jgi:hypothetical protein